MAKDKLTKRDLTGDELKTGLDRAWTGGRAWIAAHPDWARVIIFALVVVIVGIPLYIQFRNYQETKANAVMSEGKTYLVYAARSGTVAERNSNYQAAVTKFQSVIDDYRGTSVYPEALKSAALASSGMGQDEAALGFYDRFLAELDGHPDYRQVQFAKAGVLQEVKRYAEAVKLYEELLAAPDAAFLRPHVCFQLASVYDLGLNQPQKAIEYYQQVPPAKPGAIELWYSEARLRLAALGAPLPAVDGDTAAGG